jgi:hypothetical protein
MVTGYMEVLIAPIQKEQIGFERIDCRFVTSLPRVYFRLIIIMALLLEPLLRSGLGSSCW